MTIPEYSYHCENCDNYFSKITTIEDYQPKVRCPQCNKKGLVYRDFSSDEVNASVRLGLNDIKTVGHYAERQTEMKSEDELREMRASFNKYRTEGPEKELPSGMKKKKLSDKKIVFHEDTNVKISKEESMKTQKRAELAKQRKNKK
jgi:putative FmdB family regulatory protein